MAALGDRGGTRLPPVRVPVHRVDRCNPHGRRYGALPRCRRVDTDHRGRWVRVHRGPRVRPRRDTGSRELAVTRRLGATRCGDGVAALFEDDRLGGRDRDLRFDRELLARRVDRTRAGDVGDEPGVSDFPRPPRSTSERASHTLSTMSFSLCSLWRQSGSSRCSASRRPSSRSSSTTTPTQRRPKRALCCSTREFRFVRCRPRPVAPTDDPRSPFPPTSGDGRTSSGRP